MAVTTRNRIPKYAVKTTRTVYLCDTQAEAMQVYRRNRGSQVFILQPLKLIIPKAKATAKRK